MHKDKYVFALLVSFLDRNHFNYLVRKYGGDKYVKSYHLGFGKHVTKSNLAKASI